MATPYSKVIKNFIEFNKKPFTSQNVIEETSIDPIKVKRALAVFLKKGRIQVISRQGKYKIYIKNNEYKEEPITNRYGFNFRMMKKMFNLIKSQNISSSRSMQQETGYHRRAIDRYLVAFASAKIITLAHGYYKPLISEPNYASVGQKIEDGILSRLRRENAIKVKSHKNITFPGNPDEDTRTKEENNIIKRDTAVHSVMKRAYRLQARIAEDKRKMRAEIESYLNTAPKHMLNQDGLVELVSSDQRSKIIIGYEKYIELSNNLQEAKLKFEYCLERWNDNTLDNLKLIVTRAFHLNSRNRINKSLLINLMKYRINDEHWLQALDLVETELDQYSKDQVMYFYERKSTKDEFKLVSLDFSTI